MEMLICTKCRDAKPASASHFPPHAGKKNGFDSWCRDCRATYRSSTRRGRYRKFGCPDEVVRALVAEGQCTICGNDGPRLCVDHDHKRGVVRGLLCMNCNQGIGKFKDDPELLEFARIYLLDALGHPEAEKYLAGAA